MKTRKMYRTSIALAVVCSLLTTATGVAMAEMRVDDLPNPIPQVMDKVKEVGNEVGKGISKAASTTAGAVNKAVKGEKSDNQKSQTSTK
jgi:hypothetical protein